MRKLWHRVVKKLVWSHTGTASRPCYRTRRCDPRTCSFHHSAIFKSSRLLISKLIIFFLSTGNCFLYKDRVRAKNISHSSINKLWYINIRVWSTGCNSLISLAKWALPKTYSGKPLGFYTQNWNSLFARIRYFLNIG